MIIEYNPHLFIPLIAWLIAQSSKFFLTLSKGEVNLKLFYSSGGMPSAHAAVVVGLATTALLIEGLRSPLFGVTAILAGVVIYDAFGVRRVSGKHGRAINKLLSKVSVDGAEILSKEEQIGHEPKEILVGGVIGFLSGLVFTLNYWTENTEYLTQGPTEIEKIIYFGFFALLLILAIIGRFWLSKKAFRRIAVIKNFKKILFTTLSSFSISGLFLVLAQYQLIPVVNWRLWIWILLLIFLATVLTFWMKWLKFLPNQYRQEVNNLKTKSSQKRR